MRDELIKLIESIDTEKVLTDEQREQLNTFGDSIVEKLNAEREEGYNAGFDASKEIAETHLVEYEAEIDTSVTALVEQIDTLIEKREELAVVEGTADINDQLVEKLDAYLDVYVKESAPEALVVDYKRLSTLEKMAESMRKTCLISDADVHAKITEIEESINESNESNTEDLKLKTEQLQTEMEHRIQVESELNKMKAEQLINCKVKDIPDLEASKLLKHFAEASVEEIEKDFDEVYENIKYKEVSKTDSEFTSYDKIKSIIEEITPESDVEDDDDADDKVTESVQMQQYADITKKSCK
jgi:hypothetical protein